MKKKVQIMALIGLCALLSVGVQAQTVSKIPYEFGFEATEQAELSNWVLNPGADASYAGRDHWVVGSSVRSAGSQALYISYDGTSATSANQAVTQYAYRDFVLPGSASGGPASYTISFDWLCEGTSRSVLAVGYAKVTSSTTGFSANKQGTMPPSIHPYTGMNALNGQSVWQYASFKVNGNGQDVLRLFFVWRNTNNNPEDTLAMPMGACIDNIQITSDRALRPDEFTASVATCDSVLLSWIGTSAEYELSYRKSGDQNWTVYDGIESRGLSNSFWLEGLDETAYDFRLRGFVFDNGDTLPSPYVYLKDYFVFCPEKHCINYVDLHNPEVATCTYGTADYQQWPGGKTAAFQNSGVVDFGYESSRSQHTVIWDRTATDPRTGGGLKLVPDGEIASIRLGNWETGYGAEAIAYDYVVDSTNAIMLIKYAVVQENPSGHGEFYLPRFVLDVLDENGNPIDAQCGGRNFYAGDENAYAEWHSYRGAGSYGEVLWQDWSTIGLDLSAHVGQRVTIRFANYDCFMGGDYGYSYFTLGCASATIDINSCGEGTSMEAIAPDGFDYMWFLSADSLLVDTDESKVLSRDRMFYPTDSAEFTCRLTYKSMDQCMFELHSVIYPRFPRAQFSYKYAPKDCMNRVEFTNESYVQTRRNGQFVAMKNERLDEYEWNIIGPGVSRTISTPNPVVSFPQAGGTYYVELTGFLSNRECWETVYDTIHIPEIGESYAEESQTVCFHPGYVMWEGEKMDKTGTYNRTFKSVAGCDSVVVLKLTVLPDMDRVLPDTFFCYGDHLAYVHEGDQYPADMPEKWIRFKTSPEGCDYTIVQNVRVAAPIEPEIRVQDIDETHEYAGIFLSGTGYSYYTVDGEKNVDLSIIENPRPYNIAFYNEDGCVVDTVIEICPNMIYQRWNDVLSLKNKAAGGYDYEPTSYQWFKNGVAIEGATQSYYYEEGGLDQTAVYTAHFIEKGKTEVRETCPYVPKHYESTLSLSPTRVAAAGEVVVKTPAEARVECYSTMGVKMMDVKVPAGQSGVAMPSLAGFYLVKVSTDTEKQTYRVQVTD